MISKKKIKKWQSEITGSAELVCSVRVELQFSKVCNQCVIWFRRQNRSQNFARISVHYQLIFIETYRLLAKFHQMAKTPAVQSQQAVAAAILRSWVQGWRFVSSF
jgi:hypothetical protein